jgi:nitroreductase
MDLFKAIRERRSIRKYKPGPVSEGDLKQVLEAARWAPSWANTQCCRFVVVRDKELKDNLAQTLPERNPARAAIGQAPIVIVVCAYLGKSGCFKGEPVTDKGDWFMFDVALAMQNLTLVAHALGLGTVHVGFFDARKAAELVSLPEGMAVVELMPLGWPDEQGKAPVRMELSELVSYDKFEKNF